jgi:5-methylcytosine-specific restriction endonuclease McrA
MSGSWKGGSDTRWRVFRAGILKRDRYLCRVRGKGCTNRAPLVGGHVDHIISLAMGGQKYDPANARAACAHCNTSRRVAVAEQEPPPKRVSTW